MPYNLKKLNFEGIQIWKEIQFEKIKNSIGSWKSYKCLSLNKPLELLNSFALKIEFIYIALDFLLTFTDNF